MKIESHISAPAGFLFNADLGPIDAGVFDLPASEPLASALGGRAAVRFATLDQLPVVIKQYHRGGMARRVSADLYWFGGFERSRSWREIRLLAHMRQLQLPVPLPVAGSVHRVAGCWYRCALVTGRIEAAFSLAERLSRSALAGDQWRELGRTIQRFQQAGVYHADLNAHNILLDSAGQFHLIDFDRGKILPQGRWQRANLDRLYRSLCKLRAAGDNFQFNHDDWRALASTAVHANPAGC